MDIDFKKLAPWNWFKKEQEEQQTASSALPVQRNDVPVTAGAVSPILQLHREMNLSPEGGRQEAGCHATSFSFLA